MEESETGDTMDSMEDLGDTMLSLRRSIIDLFFSKGSLPNVVVNERFDTGLYMPVS